LLGDEFLDFLLLMFEFVVLVFDGIELFEDNWVVIELIWVGFKCDWSLFELFLGVVVVMFGWLSLYKFVCICWFVVEGLLSEEVGLELFVLLDVMFVDGLVVVWLMVGGWEMM